MALRLSAVIVSLVGWVSVVFAAATLENPSPGALKSGVGVISGWVCDAEELEVSFDGGTRLFVPYGSERTDTAGVCGDTDNGFGLLINYNNLGDGPHTATLYVDGILTTRVDFNVQTLGTDFLRGVTGSGMIALSDGKQVNVQWEETTQGFTITGYTSIRGPDSTSAEQQLRGLVGTWHFTLDVSRTDPSMGSLTRIYSVRRIEETALGPLALGVDPVDESEFGVISAGEPFVIGGQRYVLYMADVDVLSTGYFCTTYKFNRSGDQIAGYFLLMRASGPLLENCDLDQSIAEGPLTGRRQ